MKPPFLISGIIFLVLLAAPAEAEVRGHSGELFWLDVPEGWAWAEEEGGVTLSEIDGSGEITIRFEEVEGIKDPIAARELTYGARDDRRYEVAERNGKSVMKRERRLDGVFTLHTSFLIFTPQGMRQATSLVSFNKGHLFDIYFEATHEVFRLEMEKIVDTWSFEKPEEPEEFEEPEKDDGKE